MLSVIAYSGPNNVGASLVRGKIKGSWLIAACHCLRSYNLILHLANPVVGATYSGLTHRIPFPANKFEVNFSSRADIFLRIQSNQLTFNGLIFFGDKIIKL